MKFLAIACFVLALGHANSQLIHGHELTVLVEKAFAELDTNHDNVFELAEMQASIKASDDNGDGLLQCNEYYNHTAIPAALAKEIFTSFDTNGDCTMSDAEVSALLTRMDQNGDGKVTIHEFDHFYTQLMKHLGHLDHGHGHVVG